MRHRRKSYSALGNTCSAGSGGFVAGCVMCWCPYRLDDGMMRRGERELRGDEVAGRGI